MSCSSNSKVGNLVPSAAKVCRAFYLSRIRMRDIFGCCVERRSTLYTIDTPNLLYGGIRDSLPGKAAVGSVVAARKIVWHYNTMHRIYEVNTIRGIKDISNECESSITRERTASAIETCRDNKVVTINVKIGSCTNERQRLPRYRSIGSMPQHMISGVPFNG